MTFPSQLSSRSIQIISMSDPDIVLQYPYGIIVALLCKLAVMSKKEGKLNLCLFTNISFNFPSSTINSWDRKDRIISLSHYFIMEVVFNIILRNIKALLWLSALALSSVIVVPWCILHILLQSSKDRKRWQEIPQNEKRTVLLTGGPLTKGNIDSKIIFFFKGIMTCLTRTLLL